jgi:hypothetical protein
LALAASAGQASGRSLRPISRVSSWSWYDICTFSVFSRVMPFG